MGAGSVATGGKDEKRARVPGRDRLRRSWRERRVLERLRDLTRAEAARRRRSGGKLERRQLGVGDVSSVDERRNGRSVGLGGRRRRSAVLHARAGTGSRAGEDG